MVKSNRLCISIRLFCNDVLKRKRKPAQMTPDLRTDTYQYRACVCACVCVRTGVSTRRMDGRGRRWWCVRTSASCTPSGPSELSKPVCGVAPCEPPCARPHLDGRAADDDTHARRQLAQLLHQLHLGVLLQWNGQRRRH